ncbi:MAG TPA: nidogen-like domain-containing protein [Coriobacteriia bacterium]|nr:nidogen-like domain-containing protein [Coriobacteriia bacterium]
MRLIACACAAMCALALLVPPPAAAEGPNAILKPTGYDLNTVPRGDDTSNYVVNLPFSMNWNGTSYTNIYINMNGNCTFGAAYSGYNPSTTLAGTNLSILAPFWADIDTRNTATGQVTYSSTAVGTTPQVNGHPAFLVNWINVAAYNNQASPLNSFQLVIVDRSDTGAGNFDFMYNYDKVTWDIATSASTYRARAGWARTGTSYELAGSGVAQASASTLLDASPSATSLIQNSMNSEGQLGRYVWQVRNGAAPNMLPHVTAVDRVLEGNSSGGYTGYAGTGDATATDEDGTVASLTNNRPAFLPLGATSVTWTATDNVGGTSTALQSIVVADTTAPTNPTLSSPSHTTSTWSASPSVTTDSSGSSDLCSGVQGFSYEWFRDAAGTPDATLDPSVTTTTTTVTTTTVDSQTFATATWPTGWTRSNATYLRLTNTAGRNHGTYAAEAWASSNTRRTVNYYRDYNLAGYSSATLSFWDNVSALAGGGDYAMVEYSTNGGTSYTTLQNLTAASPWTRRNYALPVGGTVRVRFAASVAGAGEYADWDDVEVNGYTSTTSVATTTHTVASLADGRWYFGLRTQDNAGNWATTASLGPFLIDTVAPVTTDNAPAGWQTSPVAVALTPTDAGTLVATRYKLDIAGWADYAAPVSVSAEGTSTLQYYSVDAAGHIESTRTATVRIDTVAPSVPTSLAASADTTSSVELTWEASTDSVSGVDLYEVLRDGVVIDYAYDTYYDDVGLESGTEYSYEVRAVDVAGNRSAACPAASVRVPYNELQLTLDTLTVTFDSVDPGTRAAKAVAVTASVSGVGTVPYELLCSAQDFVRTEPGASVLLPAQALAFTTSGEVNHPELPFSTAQYSVDTNVGASSTWRKDYVFGYALDVPWDIDPGTYTTKVTYTVVTR